MSDPRITTLLDLALQRKAENSERVDFTFLVDGEQQVDALPRRELDRRARACAVALANAGLTKGSRALLVFPPGIDYLCAVYGCLYAGVVAVPAYPPDPTRLARTIPRLQAIAKEADVSIVLTTRAMLDAAESVLGSAPELVSSEWMATDALPIGRTSAWEAPDIVGDDLAFIQFTSGSTGIPRGVPITHANVLSNLDLIHRKLSIATGDLSFCWLPPYHDWGLIGGLIQPLYSDTPTILMSPIAFLQQPLRWLEGIARYGATISFAPTFAYDLCVRRTTPEIRRTLDLSKWTLAAIAAEPVRADTMARFAAAFAPSGFRPESLYPCYGLAEATLIVTGGERRALPKLQHIDTSEFSTGRASTDVRSNPRVVVGCGTPLAGESIAIVHPETREECPESVVGEIWFRGRGVASAYWRRDDESAATFGARTHPTGEGPFLRTGDLGYLCAGELFVTGRRKDVIIVRGRNLYAHDLEVTAVQAHHALRPGSAAAFGIDGGGDERLVLVCEVEPARLDSKNNVTSAIRASIAEAHEVAVHDIALIRPRTLLKTSSGKIRRNACRAAYLSGSLDRLDLEPPIPAPGPGGKSASGHPELLEWLRERIAAALDMEALSIPLDQPLAEIGIDSLAAVEIAFDVDKRFGVSLSSATLLEGVHIEELAADIAAREREFQESSHSPADESGSLSRGQQALWFVEQIHPESTAQVVAMAVHIHGGLDSQALRRALLQVIQRHECLRLQVTTAAGRPVGRTAAELEGAFREHDATRWSPETLAAALRAESSRPFELDSGSLVRITVFRRDAGDRYLVLSAHHMVVDLQSFLLVVRDLEAAYLQQLEARAATMPVITESSTHYAQYVQWQRALLAGPAGRRLVNYWRAKLDGCLPLLEIPTDRKRDPKLPRRGGIHRFEIDQRLSDSLRDLARRLGCTRYVLLLAAYVSLIHRYTGHADFIIGSPFSGRTRRQWRDVVGYFANLLPLRANMPRDLAFSLLVTQLRTTVLEALDHQDLPFASIVEAARIDRHPGCDPLVQICFSFESGGDLDSAHWIGVGTGQPGSKAKFAGHDVEAVDLEGSEVQYDFALRISESGERLIGAFQYDRHLYDTETVRRIARHFEVVLAAILANPDQRVSTIRLLDEGERRQILETWNQTTSAYPRHRCIHELVRDHAAETPDAVAVSFNGRNLSYGELDDQANRLADTIRAAGIDAGELVPVCASRSVEMVVGALAVMKAGGAYVPLDPGLPPSRLEFMLDDIGARVHLAQPHVWERLKDGRAGRIHLSLDFRPAGVASSSPQPRVDSDTAAYAIYTSGSTGLPKAARVPHRALTRLFFDERAASFQPSDVVGLAANFSFDVCAAQMWGALAAGSRLLIIPEETLTNAAEFTRCLASENVTVMDLTPSLFSHIAREQPGAFGGLRLLLLGGEAVDPRWISRVVEAGGPKRVIGVYGPTEVTVYSCAHVVQDPQSESYPLPLGRPLLNTEVYVLDPDLEPVPIGVMGEICISGAGMSHGYHRRPELDSEKFVPNPHSSNPSSRLYRSGDVGRFRADGVLEFHGRLDHQVKIRGFRIELGEIEAALGQHEAVETAVATVWEPTSGARRLVAHVVPSRGSGVTADTLREFLKDRLPGYMVPAHITLTSHLPRTPTGKVDRLALPPPQQSRRVAPVASDLERLMLELWEEVLGSKIADANGDFFSLGGDSLSAARLVANLSERLGREVSIQIFLNNPTIASLASALSDDLDRASIVAEVGSGPSHRGSSPTHTALGPHLRVERRSLLGLIAAGVLPRPEAAAVSYVPDLLVRRLVSEHKATLDAWFNGLPLLAAYHELSIGRIVTLVVPVPAARLYVDSGILLDHLVEAAKIAGSIGARALSLTGLLPSASDFGRALSAQLDGAFGPVPAITTGHATTVATVAMNLERLIQVADRRIAEEHVGCLGLGSIGRATLRHLLATMEHPEKLTLCDVFAKREELERLAHEVESDHSFGGKIEVHCSTAGVIPNDFYHASVVIGATNVADVLDVAKLRPGTLVVDDSGPHCFSVVEAVRRMESAQDVLFTAGGYLRAPEPIAQTNQSLPRDVDLRGTEFMHSGDSHRITGCMLSSLLSACFALPTTLGPGASVDLCAQNRRELMARGFEAPPLHFAGYTVADRQLRTFRRNHATRSAPSTENGGSTD